jgi:hypothetical protein
MFKGLLLEARGFKARALSIGQSRWGRAPEEIAELGDGSALVLATGHLQRP